MDRPSTALNEYTDDNRRCRHCNLTGHIAPRCPLRPLPTSVRQTTITSQQPSTTNAPQRGHTSNTTRHGPSGTTTSSREIRHHHFLDQGTHQIIHIDIGGNLPVVHTTQVRDRPKRRRRKRPNKSARRARMATEQTKSQDPTPAVAKTEENDEKMIQ
ncbi:uncharacterized protein CDV56_103079 [Aspergillus thermomutatus]|uniref:Uncharacterized protein n=1 Tax=Aspergillus thermomutatus TaxID=41047 RepID=A0A397GI08_ASPTH|nr:uncharacterized protein CDV56_103079 [Aspergillus thermomutatus]RHZ49384.1 hypothetical protein CDV56_103079 [Aspergillus thermomutatus]